MHSGIATSSEIALNVLAAKVGMDKETLKNKFIFMAENQFDSFFKRMSVVYQEVEEETQEEKPQSPKLEIPSPAHARSKSEDTNMNNIEIIETNIECNNDKEVENPVVTVSTGNAIEKQDVNSDEPFQERSTDFQESTTVDQLYNFREEKDLDTKKPKEDYNKMEMIEKQNDNLNYLFMKGSLESVLSTCTSIMMDNGEISQLTKDRIRSINRNATNMAKNGLRVLALAYKRCFRYTTELTREELDKNMVFCGICGIMDPPRPESKGAVELAHRAGIEVTMLTGDHKDTASSIAKQIGILKDPLNDRVLVGAEFEEKAWPILPKVVARCNPNTKIKMIDELHQKKRFVVMTGSEFLFFFWKFTSKSSYNNYIS